MDKKHLWFEKQEKQTCWKKQTQYDALPSSLPNNEFSSPLCNDALPTLPIAATIPAPPTPNAHPTPPAGNARPAPPAANALPAACGRRWAIGRGTDVVVKRPVVEVRCGRGWGRCGSKTRRCKCEKAS